MAKLCMGCMNPLPDDVTACTVCGFDNATDQNPPHCLPVATSLQGHYIVGRLMGEFPDHLLYLAYDRQMKEPCFIQEFFPVSIGRRDTIGGVQPLEGCHHVFEEYADNFRATMRVLARMRELPAIVPVYDIFEENGTVYSVSDYCQGMTLTKKIKLSGGRIPWGEARSIFMSLLGSLVQLGDAGVRHLAICPDNILVGSDGKARLRNFSIRPAHCSGTDLAPDLKAGYAAPEQYYADEEVGAPADVYALAATIFRTVTGTEPPAGDNRAKNSDDLFMSAEVAEELTQPVCVALFNALQVLPERRTATMAQFRDQLSVTPKVSALVDEAEEDLAQVETAGEDEESQESGKSGLIAMLIISLVLLLIAVGVIVFMLVDGLTGDKADTDGGKPSSSQTTTTTTTRPVVDGEMAVVESVVGRNYNNDDVKHNVFNGMALELAGYRYDEDADEGEILEQFPAAGTEQPAGTPIRVIVNSASAGGMVKVPNVIGWDYEQAEICLKALGFKVTKWNATNSQYDRGKVDSFYSVSVGDELEVGTTIRVYVSTKDPEPELPTDDPVDTPVDTPTDDPIDDDNGDSNVDPNAPIQ